MSAVVRETKARLGCLVTSAFVGAWYAGCFWIGAAFGWRAGVVWWFAFPSAAFVVYAAVQRLRGRW